MSNENLIIVKQLPVIEEALQSISEDIESHVSAVLAMDCTEDNYKEIKKYRTELGNMFRELEERRKDVKKKILTPYEQFEDIYKHYVTNIFKPADEQIKSKIQSVENGLKQQKKDAAISYFNEYAKSVGIDFVSFDNMRIDVTMSVSAKKLKESSKLFLDKIVDDLKLIDIQEYKAEILVEYKKSLNVSQAVTIVNERHKAIEDERKRAEAAAAAEVAKNEAVVKVDEAIAEENTNREELFSAPVVSDIPVEQSIETAKVYSVSFKAYGTIKQLKSLKEFMIKEGIRYEQL